MKEDKHRPTIILDSALWRAAKMRALKEGRAVQDVLAEDLQEFLRDTYELTVSSDDARRLAALLDGVNTRGGFFLTSLDDSEGRTWHLRSPKPERQPMKGKS